MDQNILILMSGFSVVVSVLAFLMVNARSYRIGLMSREIDDLESRLFKLQDQVEEISKILVSEIIKKKKI